jgi:hypothetical protein
VLAAALVLPVHAEAKAKRYVGTLAPSGTIGFKVTQKRHSKKKRVIGFSFFGAPVTCQEGAKTTRGVVDFPARLKNGRFKIVAANHITGASLSIHGNLRAGTLRVSGNLPIDPSGQGTGCDSGVLAWTAHRG